MERSKTLVKNMEINPKSFRKEHLAIRNAMSEKEVAEKSGVIVKRLLQTSWYQNAQEIFAYYPLKNEVDCRTLFLQAWTDGKKIALPKTREENQMDFYYIDDFMQLKEGAFHVMEPMENCVRAVPDKQPVIVPGSVFGRDGSRYGYGKGYYDRFFAKNPKLKRYAVCYANQLEESLVTDIYDVEMHEIYTEAEVIRKDR
jgi:5-formyltetrahydrofolate cyclo-ligase